LASVVRLSKRDEADRETTVRQGIGKGSGYAAVEVAFRYRAEAASVSTRTGSLRTVVTIPIARFVDRLEEGVELFVARWVGTARRVVPIHH
jgi:hypothetical protein